MQRGNAAVHREGSSGGRSCLGHTSQTRVCFSSSFFNPIRKKHIPRYKTLPKKSAGRAPPAGMCWAEPTLSPGLDGSGQGLSRMSFAGFIQTHINCRAIPVYQNTQNRFATENQTLSPTCSTHITQRFCINDVALISPVFIHLTKAPCCAQVFSSQSDINAPPLLQELDVSNVHH